MGEVNITIGGRSFKLGCDDGEETHLLLLAEHLDKHVENLRVTIGKTGDEQLFLMAGLMVCDELWDSRDALLKLEEKWQARVITPAQVDILPPEARPIAPARKPGAAGGKFPARKPVARPAATPGPAAGSKPIVKQT
ncbi:MAG: cell division protein ZapA [bacterium]|nr:cell division protein ZapA [bacterium]